MTAIRDFMELEVVADDLTSMARDIGIITLDQRYYVVGVNSGETRFVVMHDDPDLRGTQPLKPSPDQIIGVGGVGPYYKPAAETIQRGLVVLRALLAARVAFAARSSAGLTSNDA